MKLNQVAMVQTVSRLLGIYTHDMVEDALRQQNRCMTSRCSQGLTPTHKEIIRTLSHARWHTVLRPGSRKCPTIYIYEYDTGVGYNARKIED